MRQPIIQVLAAGIGQAKNSVLELVFPAACRLCGEPLGSGNGSDFCAACDAALRVSEPLMRAACPRCGFPRTGAPNQVSGQSATPAIQASAFPLPPSLEESEERPMPGCGRCRDQSFTFSGVAALWMYQDRVRDAVVAAKYPGYAALGHALGRKLGVRVAETFGDELPDLVTFTPSHLFRQLSRGGNGVQVIAAAVSRVLRKPCRPLVRLTRSTAKQAWLDDQQREQNVRGAFAIKKSYAFANPRGLNGRHVLLVDDVLTTGATANELSSVVRQAGARRVSLAVVARAVRTS